MNIQFGTIRPRHVPVDRLTAVDGEVRLDQLLDTGDTFSFAFPVAWYCRRYCVTFTKAPQCESPGASDFMTITSPTAEWELTFETIMLPSGKPKGHVRKLTGRVVRGSIPAGTPIRFRLANYRAPWMADRGSIRFWVNGEELSSPLEIIATSGPAQMLRVIVPSGAKPGEPFPVRVVSLDPFWNLSSSVFKAGRLSFYGGKVIEKDLSFSGSYATTAVVKEEGIHRFEFAGTPLQDTLIEDYALSNPIRIAPDAKGPFWGDLHCHDTRHNCGAGEHPLEYAQNASCLDFVAVTPDYRGLSEPVWRRYLEDMRAVYRPDEFTTIPSFEAGFLEGHHNVYFRNEEYRMFDTSDESLLTIDALLKGLDRENSFLIPHHVGVHWRPQAKYHAERDPWIPAVEIYSQHGLGEKYEPEHALSYEHNRTRGKEQKYASSVDRSVYVQDALAQGRRYGIVASCDDHMGQPAKPFKGIAAIWADRNTREGLFDALQTRNVYGTTGERILLSFHINNASMGNVIQAAPGETLRIEFEVNGTDRIAFVQIERYLFEEGRWSTAYYKRIEERNLFQEGKVVQLLDYSETFEEQFQGDVVYYLRMAQQKSLNDYPVFAWSSPIWVERDSMHSDRLGG